MIGLLSSLTASDVLSASSPPTSTIISKFVLETDNIYGFQILRPASWVSKDLGDRREFRYVDPIYESDQLSLVITNLEVINRGLNENSLNLNYELFKLDPSIGPWMEKTELSWKMSNIEFSKIREFNNGMVYVIKPDQNQLYLASYIISNSEPIVLGLIGYGAFNNLDNIINFGILDDFMTMAQSVSSYSSIKTYSLNVSNELQTFLIEAGPWHSDSGYLVNGVFTYRLQTDYYQAPPRVYWLYEYMHYGGDPYHDTWLYSTSITDYPQITCVYGNSYLLWHRIEKVATYPSNTVSDSYTPNQVVSHLNTTTAHMMIFGDPILKLCQWYFPFTH